MNKNKSIVFILSAVFLFSVLGIGFLPTALASGKSIYGTLYMDGAIADPGVTITFKVDGVIVDQTTTVVWDGDNFILGFNSTYEGSMGYFYVGDDDLVPTDNASVYIGTWIGKQIDLHVTVPSSGDDTQTGGGSSGGGSSGGSSGGTTGDSNTAPVADAGGPYTGTTTEEIILNGADSYDPDGDPLSYNWDFGDGTSGSGVLVGHMYPEGTYTATLTVSDGSLSDDDTAEVTVVVGNHPPAGLTLTGNTSGHADETLSFSVVATDPDDDLIKYVFDWDDSSSGTESSYIGSGTFLEVPHFWSNPGIYTVTVYAEDGMGAQSESVTLEVAIDALAIGNGDVSGVLIDEDSDDSYDGFINDATGIKTAAQVQDDGKTAFDADGDDEFDHLYDPDTNTITEMPGSSSGVDSTTIGIVIVLFIVLLLLIFLLLRRRRDDEEDTEKSKAL